MRNLIRNPREFWPPGAAMKIGLTLSKTVCAFEVMRFRGGNRDAMVVLQF